jgi:MFS family permease
VPPLSRLAPLGTWVPPAVRRNARIDLAAAAFFGVFGGLTRPFVAFMARDRLGASAIEVSIVIAAEGLVLLLSLWFARFVRARHPVRLVIVPSIIARTLLLLMPAVHTPAAYVAVILGHYAIGSISTLGYAQVMRAVYPPEIRGRIMALVRVGMALMWIIASLLGGRLMQFLPFQWVFAAAGCFGVTSSLIFSRMRLPQDVPAEEPIDLSRTREILRENRPYRLFLTGLLVYGFGVWFISPAIPLLLVDVLHATSFQAGLLGAVSSATWLFSYTFWGRMIDRRSAAGTMSVILFIGAITPTIYFLSTNAWVVQLAGVTEGLTSAGFDLGWLTAVLEYAPPGQIRHYVAIYNTAVGLRGSTAPFLSGALLPLLGPPHVAVRVVFAIGITLSLSGALILRRAIRRAPPRAA